MPRLIIDATNCSSEDDLEKAVCLIDDSDEANPAGWTDSEFAAPSSLEGLRDWLRDRYTLFIRLGPNARPYWRLRGERPFFEEHLRHFLKMKGHKQPKFDSLEPDERQYKEYDWLHKQAVKYRLVMAYWAVLNAYRWLLARGEPGRPGFPSEPKTVLEAERQLAEFMDWIEKRVGDVGQPEAQQGGKASSTRKTRKASGGRPRKWEDLWAMIQEADSEEPKPKAQAIAGRYNRRFGGPIGEGKRERATAAKVQDVRNRYPKLNHKQKHD